MYVIYGFNSKFSIGPRSIKNTLPILPPKKNKIKKKPKTYPKFCIHYIWLITLYFILIPKLSLSFSSFTRVLLYKKYQNKTLYTKNTEYQPKQKTIFISSHHAQQKFPSYLYTHAHTHTHLKTIRTNKINTNV